MKVPGSCVCLVAAEEALFISMVGPKKKEILCARVSLFGDSNL